MAPIKVAPRPNKLGGCQTANVPTAAFGDVVLGDELDDELDDIGVVVDDIELVVDMLMDVTEKESEVLVDANAQNCSTRFSVDANSAGQSFEMQDMIWDGRALFGQ